MKMYFTTIFILLCITDVNAQKIELKPEYKISPYPLKKYFSTGELTLFPMTGFNDTVEIFSNKKLITKVYLKSLTEQEVPLPPLHLILQFRKNISLLEFKKNSSGKTYYTTVNRGYPVAWIYLDEKYQPAGVIYTNKYPLTE